MRKIDIIAKEKFNGDTIQTLNYLLENNQSIEQYIDELTKEEAQIVLNWASEKAHEKFGGRENFERKMIREIELDSLNITEEEIKNAKKNPYKAKIFKGFLKMLLIDGGIVSLALISSSLGINPEILGLLGATITGMFSLGMANNVMKYFKFKKIKNQIIDENTNSDQIENGTEKDIGRIL